MKKRYEKPQICVETFYLSEHIAACDWVWNQVEQACPAVGNTNDGAPAISIFNADLACDMESDYNTCYFAPDGSVILASS